MTIRAYAKINIGLHILAKRPDGYHNLETIFHEINLFDEISLTMSNDLQIECNSALVPIDSSNLCMKAARLLQEEYKIAHGVKIVLCKNIPIGAGLGGGSSDAAATLIGLNELWKLHCNPDDLRRFGARIGSDVPFFIKGGSAYATGRGEVLEHLRLEIPFWIVLVTPPIHVSTAWAYRNVIVQRNGRLTGLKNEVIANLKNSHALALTVHNDFEVSVFEQYPVIRDVKKELLHAGAAFALMSGSGSSVFGLFDNEAAARLAANSFPQEYLIAFTPPYFMREPV